MTPGRILKPAAVGQAGNLIGSAEATARFFKVLSDPTRLAILRLLLEREHSVGELVEQLGVPENQVSNHLACLLWCHFVTVGPESRLGIHSASDDPVRAVLAEADQLSDEQRAHLVSCTCIGPTWL